MERPAKKAVVLLSGGLDSAVCLACARRDGLCPIALSFDYAQRHAHELTAARRVAENLGVVEHVVMRLDSSVFAGSALTDAIEVPKGRDEAAMAREIPVTYVPARNLVFLSIAAALAESRGAGTISIGVNAVDYSGYPDCRPEFIESFVRTLNLATRAGVGGEPMEVRTPLVDLSKAQIIRLGAELGVDFALTHSCYDPDAQGRACGGCDSCVLRARGFAEAGVDDPTRYVAGAR